MAYFLQNGKFFPTYESCSTSACKHRRTETIRPASNATVACAESFQKSHRAGVEEMADRIRRAAEWHSKLTKEAAMGKCISGSHVTPLHFYMSRSFLSSSCHSLALLLHVMALPFFFMSRSFSSLHVTVLPLHVTLILFCICHGLSSPLLATPLLFICHGPPSLLHSTFILLLDMPRSSLFSNCCVRAVIRQVTVIALFFMSRSCSY